MFAPAIANAESSPRIHQVAIAAEDPAADRIVFAHGGQLRRRIVRTGPGGDGPAGAVGGTVRPGSSIQGRK